MEFIIKDAKFILSSPDLKRCPAPKLPEFAFIGRSNVGKSSLINMLTDQKKLAKTSITPGKTRLINHFLVNDNWYLVDLPGYGYAKVSKEKRSEFQKTTLEYIAKRKTLYCLYVLIDSRIPPQPIDIRFVTWLGKNEIPFILFTGKGREEVAVKALNLGADGYYNKQGNPETVYGELAHGITLVTEKAKAKSALEASEKRYHTLMDNAAEAIFIHDIKGKLLDVNLQACKNLQYSREELLSKSIKDISVTAEDEKHTAEIWSKVLAGNTVNLQSTQIRKDKSRFPIEVTLSTIF